MSLVGKTSPSRDLREPGTYALGLAFCAVYFFLQFARDPNFTFLHPFSTVPSDMYGYLAQFKGLVSGEWYPFFGFRTSRLGAPFGLNFSGDFPLPEQLQYTVVWILRAFTRDAVLAFNFYYLFTFLAVFAASFWALRRMALGRPVALVVAVLYAFIPFHAIRMNHIMLANYALVMPCLYLVLKLWGGAPLFACEQPRLSRNWRLLLFCLAVPMWHVYYAFFFGMLIVAVGLGAALRRATRRPLFEAAAVCLLLGVGLGTVLLPSVINNIQNGKNTQTAQRAPLESELYALRLSSLVRPHPDHRLAEWRRVAKHYQSVLPAVEGTNEGLGTLGLLGLALLGITFFAQGVGLPPALNGLSLIVSFLLTYGSVGGLSGLFANYISPMIRCPNRVSVFIVGACLMALAVGLEALREKWKPQPALWATGLGLLGILGLLDQNPDSFVINQSHAQYVVEKEFFTRVEASLPADTAILQLPYVVFPEGPARFGLLYYGHLKAYLLTNHLRWSYGAMRGRPAAEAVEALSGDLAKLDWGGVRVAGYGAVYVDRSGFSEADSAALLQRLRKEVDPDPLSSQDGALWVFRLN